MSSESPSHPICLLVYKPLAAVSFPALLLTSSHPSEGDGHSSPVLCRPFLQLRQSLPQKLSCIFTLIPTSNRGWANGITDDAPDFDRGTATSSPLNPQRLLPASPTGLPLPSQSLVAPRDSPLIVSQPVLLRANPSQHTQPLPGIMDMWHGVPESTGWRQSNIVSSVVNREMM